MRGGALRPASHLRRFPCNHGNPPAGGAAVFHPVPIWSPPPAHLDRSTTMRTPLRLLDVNAQIQRQRLTIHTKFPQFSDPIPPFGRAAACSSDSNRVCHGLQEIAYY